MSLSVKFLQSGSRGNIYDLRQNNFSEHPGQKLRQLLVNNSTFQNNTETNRRMD